MAVAIAGGIFFVIAIIVAFAIGFSIIGFSLMEGVNSPILFILGCVVIVAATFWVLWLFFPTGFAFATSLLAAIFLRQPHH